jgi:hypothetical protein
MEVQTIGYLMFFDGVFEGHWREFLHAHLAFNFIIGILSMKNQLAGL